MQNVMILGAGPLQVPAIKVAKSLGLYVIVCDYDANAVGIPYADEFHLISTIDEEKILELARKIMPDYIITSTSDAPVRTVAYVNEQLNRQSDISYESARCATIKSEMRECLKQNNVPIPLFFVCENLEEYLEAVCKFPKECIVKPIDSAASRGVIYIDTQASKEDLKKCYCESVENSRLGKVMVEELMHGPEVSVECFVVDGEVTVVTITDKLVTELPYFVELGHSEPSQLSDAIQSEIREITKSAILAVGIINGVAHVEVMVTTTGAKIVELAARLGGDYITSKLVPLSTGVDMVKESVKLSLHRALDIERKWDKGSAIRFIQGKQGVVKQIVIDSSIEMIEGIEEVEIYVKVGDLIRDIRSSNDRIGHVVATGNHAQEAINRAERALQCINITIE